MDKFDNTIEVLRELLFDTIRRLRSADLKVMKDEVARANAIAHNAQVIVNTATVECEFMALTNSKGSGFIPITINPQEIKHPRVINGGVK